MFYDFILDIMKCTTIENEIGQDIKTYTIDKSIKCDIQPSNEYILKKTFGNDIESLFIVFCDANIDVGTIVKFNDSCYEINRKVDWIEYKIYSLKGCDVNGS